MLFAIALCLPAILLRYFGLKNPLGLGLTLFTCAVFLLLGLSIADAINSSGYKVSNSAVPLGVVLTFFTLRAKLKSDQQKEPSE